MVNGPQPTQDSSPFSTSRGSPNSAEAFRAPSNNFSRLPDKVFERTQTISRKDGKIEVNDKQPGQPEKKIPDSDSQTDKQIKELMDSIMKDPKTNRPDGPQTGPDQVDQLKQVKEKIPEQIIRKPGFLDRIWSSFLRFFGKR